MHTSKVSLYICYTWRPVTTQFLDNDMSPFYEIFHISISQQFERAAACYILFWCFDFAIEIVLVSLIVNLEHSQYNSLVLLCITFEMYFVMYLFRPSERFYVKSQFPEIRLFMACVNLMTLGYKLQRLQKIWLQTTA